MSQLKRTLSDAQGWLTLHTRDGAPGGAGVLSPTLRSPASPSRAAVSARRPQRRWVELLGTVLTQLKEQSGTVLSYACIRGAVVFTHNHEAHIIEILLPTRSMVLEIDSPADLKLWLAAITKAVGAEYCAPAQRDAAHLSAHQLLRYELEAAQLVIPLARSDSGGESDDDGGGVSVSSGGAESGGGGGGGGTYTSTQPLRVLRSSLTGCLALQARETFSPSSTLSLAASLQSSSSSPEVAQTGLSVGPFPSPQNSYMK